jgi:superfamily II DNA helicase RecQ
MLRANLQLSVFPRASSRNRMAHLCGMLAAERHLTIVYCNDIRTCDTLQCDVAEHLPLRLELFHSELLDDRKAVVLQRCRDEEVDILFCTLAFGMGIDVRVNTVIH